MEDGSTDYSTLYWDNSAAVWEKNTFLTLNPDDDVAVLQGALSLEKAILDTTEINPLRLERSGGGNDVSMRFTGAAATTYVGVATTSGDLLIGNSSDLSGYGSKVLTEDNTNEVPAGTAANQTLRWDGSAWASTSNLKVYQSGPVEIVTNSMNSETDLILGSNAVVASGVTINMATEANNGFTWRTGVTDHATGLAGGTDRMSLSSTWLESFVPLKLDTSVAGDVGRLKIIPSLSSTVGVGSASQIIGVNIKDVVTTGNKVEQQTVSGNVTGASAIVLNPDDNSYGQIGFYTSPQGSSAGTDLTPRMWIKGNGDVEVAGGLSVSGVGGTSSNWNTAYGWGDHALAGYIDADGLDEDVQKLWSVSHPDSYYLSNTWTQVAAATSTDAAVNNWVISSNHSGDVRVQRADTADNANALLGYDLTSAPTANTVVRRDSNGDLRARLLRQDYTTAAGSGDIDYIMIQKAVGTTAAGTDNFLRPATVASVRTAMNVANGAQVNVPETLSATNTTTVTGTKRFKPTTNTTDGGASPAGATSGASLEVYNDDNALGAWLTFHRSSRYAINFGLDTSGTIILGGWSDGTTVTPRMSIGTAGEMSTRGQGVLWGADNDGPSSGLNADLLDGIHGSSFLRSNSNDTASGDIGFSGGVDFTGIVQINGDTVFNGSDSWLRTHGNTGWYSASYGGGTYMIDTTWVRIYGSKRLYVANRIQATGDITAYYSDERLKTKTGSIDNALDKVKSLHGFTYVENELARSFGYSNEEEQVALSAQDVQRVMPQVVSLAPFDVDTSEFSGEITSKSGEDYLTVDYAKLVPLLVEAIKEQQIQIEELKEVVCDFTRS